MTAILPLAMLPDELPAVVILLSDAARVEHVLSPRQLANSLLIREIYFFGADAWGLHDSMDDHIVQAGGDGPITNVLASRDDVALALRELPAKGSEAGLIVAYGAGYEDVAELLRTA